MAVRLGPGDIDAIFRAIRPRLKKLIDSGSFASSPASKVPPHTHHASTVVVEPAGEEWSGYVAADDAQEAMQELDDEKLARSGVQPMLGDLDMNDHEVDGVVAIDFKTNPSHSHAAGGVHWDGDIGTLIADLTAAIQQPLGSVFVYCQNDSGSTIPEGKPVIAYGTASPSGLPSISRDSADSPPHLWLGVTCEQIDSGNAGWVCAKGYLRIAGSFNDSAIVYLDTNSPADLTSSPVDADQKGCYSTVQMGTVIDAGPGGLMFVDVRPRPRVEDLSDVWSDVTPSCGDVLVRAVNPNTGCEQYLPTGMWTTVSATFGPPATDHGVFEFDGQDRVTDSSQIVSMVPASVQAGEHSEDEHEFDCFSIAAQPYYNDGEGQWKVRAFIHSLRGPVVGQYKFNWTVSNPAGWGCQGGGV